MLLGMGSSPEGAQTKWNITITSPQYKDLQLDQKKRSGKIVFAKYIMPMKAIKVATRKPKEVFFTSTVTLTFPLLSAFSYTLY